MGGMPKKRKETRQGDGEEGGGRERRDASIWEIGDWYSISQSACRLACKHRY